MVNIKMRYHLIGMDTCVGATSKGERNGLTEDSSESCFHFRLHRVSVRLRLRTVEVCASICEGYKITHVIICDW